VKRKEKAGNGFWDEEKNWNWQRMVMLFVS
jgi:hypothetical protein